MTRVPRPPVPAGRADAAGLTGRVRICVVVALVISCVTAFGTPALAQDTGPTGPATPATSPTPRPAQSASPATPASPTPDSTSSEPALPGPMEVFAAVHADALASEEVGYVVTEADGTVLAEYESDVPRLPASTMKVLTAAAVLDTLGPHKRLATRVRSPRPPDADGVVASLVLVGAGDPTLTSQAYRTHIYPSRPATSIEELADRVVAAGVTRVTGDIIGDGTAFGPLDVAPGWPPHYLAEFDARRVPGLTIDAGLEVDTAQVDGSQRLLGQRVSEHPSLVAAWTLGHALQERGVVVDGSATMAAVPPTTNHQVAWVGSPALDEQLQFMLERSDNNLADTLVRTAGLRAEGMGTWSAGGRAVQTAMESLGADTTGLVVDDGSGLSRFDRVTPLALAQVDLGLYDQFGPSWSEWLSTAGVDGTFEDRLVGTEAQGRFHGKSGTLDDVKARSGHVVADDGSHLHMAVIGNGLSNADRWKVIVMADDLVLAMLDELDGCTRVPRGTGPDAPDDSETPPDDASDDADATANPSPAATPTEVDFPSVPLADTSAWTRVCDIP